MGGMGSNENLTSSSYMGEGGLLYLYTMSEGSLFFGVN